MTYPSRASSVRSWPPSAGHVDKEQSGDSAVIHGRSVKLGRIDSDATKKSPSVLKREARDVLAQEVRELEAQLDELRVLVGLPSMLDKAVVSQAQANNARIEQALCVNNNFLGRAQSMVENELLSPQVNAMSTFIHLPHDMTQRRAILHELQPTKLRRGIEVVMETLHHLDPLMPFTKEVRFSTNTGERHCHRFEISRRRNVRTARQLFDIIVGYLSSMEINVTETFGLLTLREDFDEPRGRSDDMEPSSTILGFAGFYNYSPITNSPLGIITVDTVNIDDLYPYSPKERTCKDIQAADLVYEVRKPGSDEVVVVLKQCYFMVQLPPQFELAPGALDKIHREMTQWPKAFTKYLHDYVVLEVAKLSTYEHPSTPSYMCH